MSRKKHNISYIKPEEPKFLRELKAAAGYKEGPDVDTKRGDFQNFSDDDDSVPDELDAEKPTVVVLKEGDLTAQEADDFEKKKKEEEAKAPADLSKRIIFESKRKSKSQQNDQDSSEPISLPKKTKKSKQSTSLLSFNEEEDE